MAYNTEELFEKASKAIKKHNLFFIQDICDFIGISKPAFYDHFKKDSDEYNELSNLLRDNTIKVKLKLRKNWQKEDSNASLQIALMKLVASSEERRKISQSYQESKDITEVKPTRYIDATKDN